ncbi:putative dipeptidyl-peptidase II [Helianthus annuus]|nr:putative dipeptidyl-peptidase II [Helianthus annuus]
MISKMSRPPLLTLALISILIGASVNATRTNTPRLSILTDKPNDESLTPDFVSYNYTQTLDHFNYKPESNTTFQQRYIVNSKYWGGPITSSPIFVYMGAEVDITSQVLGVGFFPVLASRFNGLLVYIEHRYYGTSMPFGSEEEAYKDANSLGFFSSEQALADYAQIILYLKQDLSAENCPVIVVGASYGGSKLCWGNFRNRTIREACNHSQIKLFRWFTRIIQSDTTLILRN